ncbi:unnamed protein product [Polarella glacialis]|uniref:Uncharacterized protein n=1 Tax=Polarella glacialis TaxID=89957 RepID=A0A813G7D4_POLGL|nr:unnamed protein product [Polarella glacialis]
MATRMQAIKSVTKHLTATVNPSAKMALNGCYRQPNKAAVAIIAPVQEVAAHRDHHDHHPWGVTWPGHADKWGNKEPPMVDWDEVKDTFRWWNQYDYSVSHYFYGAVGMIAEVVASKVPTGKAPVAAHGH